MGPSQICECPFREPRVFTIAQVLVGNQYPKRIFNEASAQVLPNAFKCKLCQTNAQVCSARWRKSRIPLSSGFAMPQPIVVQRSKKAHKNYEDYCVFFKFTLREQRNFQSYHMIIWSIILMQSPWRSAWKGSGVDKQVLILPRIKLCRTFWVPSTRMSPQHPTYRFCLVERSTIHFCQKDFVTDIREVYLSPRSHFQLWSLAHEIYRASKLGASIDQHRDFIRSNPKKAHVLGCQWLLSQVIHRRETEKQMSSSEMVGSSLDSHWAEAAGFWGRDLVEAAAAEPHKGLHTPPHATPINGDIYNLYNICMWWNWCICIIMHT